MKPNTIPELIENKGKDWEAVIINCRNVLNDKFLSDGNLIVLALNADTPKELSTIIKCLSQDSKERPTGNIGVIYFFNAINASRYSFSDWMKAVCHFNEWLESENRQAPFLKQLGYLQCCEDSPDNKAIHYPFNRLIDEMLSEHGFVG